MSDGTAGRSLLSRIGAPVNAAFPRLSWDLWSTRRTLEQARPGELAPALRNRWERHSGVPAGSGLAMPTILLVVPMADHVEIPWEPAVGNYSFELYETARRCLGDDRVHVLRIQPGGTAEEWQGEVVAYLNDHRITHVLGRIDIEPNASGDWSWDVFVRRLRREWPGIFLPLTYDSAYPYLSMHLDRLTRLHSRTMPVVLDRPISPVIRPHRPSAGPLFLPLSDASMEVLNAAVADVSHDLDLTFIGNVNGYPYRAALLTALEHAGLEVTVNPQREDGDSMPGFAAYARALARSRVTLNFTRCNGVPVTQLKTRLLEGSLFGTLVASDSPLYAEEYFVKGEEFISYSSPVDLRDQLTRLREDPARLQVMRDAARAKAEQLRIWNFWTKVDEGLAARGLPRLELLPS